MGRFALGHTTRIGLLAAAADLSHAVVDVLCQIIDLYEEAYRPTLRTTCGSSSYSAPSCASSAGWGRKLGSRDFAAPMLKHFLWSVCDDYAKQAKGKSKSPIRDPGAIITYRARLKVSAELTDRANDLARAHLPFEPGGKGR